MTSQNKPQNWPLRAGYEIDVGAADGGKTPFSKKTFDRYTTARTELSAIQKKFLKNPRRSNADIGELVDAMISYEKLRAGATWKEGFADTLARKYRKAIPADLGKLDLSHFSERATSSSMIRVPWSGLPDGPLVPFDGQAYDLIDLNATGSGWYFEKWFDYSDAGKLWSLVTYEQFGPRYLGGFIHASNTAPDLEDGIRCTAEGGIWFTYVPKKSGYLECLFLYEPLYGRAMRDMYPVDRPGETSVAQWVQGAVGFLSGDDFLGRNYILLDNEGYTGDGRTGTPDIDIGDPTGTSGFGTKCDWRVEAGQPVNVLIGIRVKMVAAINGPGVNFSRSFQVRSNAVGVRISDTPPPD